MQGGFSQAIVPPFSCWNVGVMSRGAAAILQACGIRLTPRMVLKDMERTWVLDDLTRLPSPPEAPTPRTLVKQGRTVLVAELGSDTGRRTSGRQ